VGWVRESWFVVRGSGLGKNVKKLKKKRQKVQKSGEKRGKRIKIEKKDAKRRAICGVFSKTPV